MADPVWRIDTLDARAGLAFASLRRANFPEDNAPPDSEPGAARNPPCVFISAPAFQPEMVANRALALAGTRGTFQYRFYVRGEEVGFPTLADLTDFVRRAYLRSGGGDGADGAGGPRPSPRPPGEDRPRLPDAPRFLDDHQSLAGQIAATAAGFYDKSKSCLLGSVERVGWPDRTSPGHDAPHVLGHAAMALIHELMNRIPDGHDPGLANRWHDDARTLGRILAAMGLWRVLSENSFWRTIETYFDRLREWKSAPAAIATLATERQYNLLRSLLFGFGPALDDSASASDLSYWAPWSIYGTAVQGPSADPISDLCRVPLPTAFATAVRQGKSGGMQNNDDEISLYHALVASVGSPATLKSNPLLCTLVLFAATWIVTHSDIHGFGPLWRPEGPASELDNVALQSKLERGWSWLRKHLPALCFAHDVERAIESASSLKYQQAAPAQAGLSS